MPKNSKIRPAIVIAPNALRALMRNPKVTMRVLLGTLLVANLAAAVMLFFPPGGSPEQLEAQLAGLRSQLQQQQAKLQRTKTIVANVEHGRSEGDSFLNTYFLARRSASSTIVAELVEDAAKSGLKAREHSWQPQPIDGTDDLSMMTITANYEGNYADFIKFIDRIDKSPRLLIIESLQAAPQQGGALHVAMKLDCFVKEDGGMIPVTGQPAAATAAGAGQ